MDLRTETKKASFNLRNQNLLTMLGSIVNDWSDIYDHLMRKRSFTLEYKINYSSKLRKWLRARFNFDKSSHTNFVFFLRVVDEERKSARLRPTYLTSQGACDLLQQHTRVALPSSKCKNLMRKPQSRITEK